MNCETLAKRALRKIKNTDIGCTVGAYEGGKCGNSWDDVVPVTFSKKQLLYLISKESEYSDLFDGFDLEDCDVDEILIESAKVAAWPDGGPYAFAKGTTATELEELAGKIDSLDEKNEGEAETLRQELLSLEDGAYTFLFDIRDGGFNFDFAEDEEIEIELTAKEAMKLLKNEHPSVVFKGMFRGTLDESFLNKKAEKMNIADDYDYFSYSGDSDPVYDFVGSWAELINDIMKGDVDKDEINARIEEISK